MLLLNRALAALKRVAIVIGIAIAFSVGLIGALILSLSSSQTRVPDIVGRDRAAAEDALSAAHLNFRVRATRPASGAKPNTVLIQIPSAGEEVKVGQTVAVDLSRPSKEGESAPSTSPDEEKKPDSASDRPSANANENRPRRNKNTNKSLNDNQNANNSNGNRNRNANTGTNSNRIGNHNLNPTETPANTSGNSNNRKSGANVNRSNSNSNSNRRQPVARPTPN